MPILVNSVNFINWERAKADMLLPNLLAHVEREWHYMWQLLSYLKYHFSTFTYIVFLISSMSDNFWRKKSIIIELWNGNIQTFKWAAAFFLSMKTPVGSTTYSFVDTNISSRPVQHTKYQAGKLFRAFRCSRMVPKVKLFGLKTLSSFHQKNLGPHGITQHRPWQWCQSWSCLA